MPPLVCLLRKPSGDARQEISATATDLLAFSPCVTQRTDRIAPAAHPDGMNTNKSIRCAIGRHRWQPTPVAGMHERICVDCGSARFDASIHPDHEARSAAVSASGLALAHSVSDGGFGGGAGGGGFGGGFA